MLYGNHVYIHNDKETVAVHLHITLSTYKNKPVFLELKLGELLHTLDTLNTAFTDETEKMTHDFIELSEIML